MLGVIDIEVVVTFAVVEPIILLVEYCVDVVVGVGWIGVLERLSLLPESRT